MDVFASDASQLSNDMSERVVLNIGGKRYCTWSIVGHFTTQ